MAAAFPLPLPAIPLEEEARAYFRQAKAANTLRAYRADWRHFEGWCAGQGREALPAAESTLVLYLTELARSHRVSTLMRRLSAIAQAHAVGGSPSPTHAAPVRTLLAGIRRAKGVAPRPKKALSTDDLRRIIQSLPPGLSSDRDRALLLTGFAGAFRRSELVALDWPDVEFVPQGMVLTIRRSKTDPEGEGRKVAIPYGRSPQLCSVRALGRWRDQAGGDTGPVFRSVDRHGNVSSSRLSDRTVARCLKKALAAVGINGDEYAGHSLRSGFATAAAAAGASERAIMHQTGHRSLPTLRRYIREGSLFEDNAAARLPL